MASRAKSLTAAREASLISFGLLVVIYVLISILPYGALTRAELAGMGQPAIGHVLQAICNTAVIIKEAVGAFLALTFPQIFGIALSSATNIVVSAGSIVQEVKKMIVKLQLLKSGQWR